MDIKPIETIYNGYKFRSRLEARWAVALDAMNIKYEYESEGYVLKNGFYYLPDFYLPELLWHAEVKPSSKLTSREDINKMKWFDNYPPENSWGLLHFTDMDVNENNDLLRQRLSVPEVKFYAALRKGKQARFEFGEAP